jgi:hypothetical protein
MIAHRIFVMMGAYLLACAAAAAIIMVGTLAMSLYWSGVPASAVDVRGLARGLPLLAIPIFIVVTITTAIPTLLIVVVAEIYRLRSIAMFAAGGVLAALVARGEISLLMSVLKPAGDHHIPAFPSNMLLHGLRDFAAFTGFAVTGVVAGLVYWRFAGRNAGNWRRVEAKA